MASVRTRLGVSILGAAAVLLAVALPVAEAVIGGYARPGGSSPIRVSLVPAYNMCTAGGANVVHGTPLAEPACNPPTATSSYVTVGTPDVDGAEANSEGSIKLTTDTGTPGPPDDADVVVRISVTDVRCKGSTTACGSANTAGGADYTGGLWVTSIMRVTDRYNGNPGPGGPESGTMIDLPFPIPVQCTETASADHGALCTVNTTMDAVIPQMVREGKRTIWELEQFVVNDGGQDGDISSQPNTPFLRQGVFVP